MGNGITENFLLPVCVLRSEEAEIVYSKEFFPVKSQLPDLVT